MAGGSMPWRRLLLLDKIENIYKTFKQYGGLRGTLRQYWLTEEAKLGQCVGIDKFGNRYMENNAFPYPRNRWVDYSHKRWLDYDASQVPPEWHKWLHHSTDKTPYDDPHTQHRWLQQHDEMHSHEPSKLYYPYSTTRTKIDSWQPKQMRDSSKP